MSFNNKKNDNYGFTILNFSSMNEEIDLYADVDKVPQEFYEQKHVKSKESSKVWFYT